MIRRPGFHFSVALWLAVVVSATAGGQAFEGKLLLLVGPGSPISTHTPAQSHQEEDETQSLAKQETTKAPRHRLRCLLPARGARRLQASAVGQDSRGVRSWSRSGTFAFPIAAFLDGTWSHRGPPSA